MKSTSNTWIADKRLFLKLPPILSPDASAITLTSLPAPPWYHWQRPDVLTQQLTILRTNFPITLGGSLLGAVGSWFAMMGLVRTSVMSYWLLSHFMVVLAVFTVIHWLVPWKLKKHHSLSSLAVTLSCCMGAMGLTWGSFAVIAASDGQDVALPFAIAIIGGVSSGAVSLSSSLLWGSISYLFWPVALMIVCCIGLGGQFYYFAAMMLIVYFGLMVMQSRNTEQALCRGIEHQLQNVDLVRLLQQESSAAKTANQDAQEARLRAEQAVTIAEKANQHLAELAQQLSKYLSPQLYLAIFRGEKQVKVGVDRKKLSVLFCDIVNFTSITENMEPMVLASWLNGYLNDMAEIVQTFGGTLDKFIGDAVMVFFGDPHSRGDEQDAIICVKMALVMQQQALARGIFVRIGINTGDVTVGNFGSEARMDYTVIGNTVNVSARLESASMPGKILISEATYALVKSSIYCVPNGFVYLKGIENSVMTYWAIKEY